jgi:hypothetical protein
LPPRSRPPPSRSRSLNLTLRRTCRRLMLKMCADSCPSTRMSVLHAHIRDTLDTPSHTSVLHAHIRHTLDTPSHTSVLHAHIRHTLDTPSHTSVLHARIRDTCTHQLCAASWLT